MAKHIVKCPICGKSFDRETTAYHQDGRRYLHIECWARQEASKTQDDKDREAGCTTSEYVYQKKALIYQFEIKKGDIKQANGGIGIVPYVYEQAREYYYQIWLAQQKNEDKVLNDYIPDIVKIKIKNPQKQPKRRNLFSFLDKEEDDGDK